MNITVRIAALAAVLLALAGTHWRAYTMGERRERDAQAAAQLQAAQIQADRALTQTNTTIKAQDERAQTQTHTATERLRTADDIERLRLDLDAARAAAQSASTCTEHAGASDELFRAMAADIERLAKQGADIAQAADGHAGDAVMLKTILDAQAK